MTIRNITAADKEALKPMVFGLYEEDDLDTEMTDEIFDRNVYQALKNNESLRIVIFEANGKPAGYSMLMKQWAGDIGGWLLMIDELYVNKDFRGHGLATHFFDWLDKEYSNAVSMFYLETSRDNESARRLYRKMGFKESSFKSMYKTQQQYKQKNAS